MFDILSKYGTLLLVGSYPNGPLGGLALTLILSVLGIGLAFPISIVLALCRLSPYGVLRVPATVVVYVVRGVPLIMQVFWGYFLVPVLTGHTVSAVTTLVVTLVVYEAAYMAEIVRAGIQALPKGQTESAKSLGLSYSSTMRAIILPQSLFNMLPALLSQFISTVKETSLGYVISVQELTFAANEVNSNLLIKPFDVYLILSLTYFAVCMVLTRAAIVMESAIRRRRAGGMSMPRPLIVDQVQAG